MRIDEVIQFIEARAKGLKDKRSVAQSRGLKELYQAFDDQLQETLLTLSVLQKKAEVPKPWYEKLMFWRKK